jgi:hypothetical protein
MKMAAVQGFFVKQSAARGPESRISLLNSLITGNSHGDWFDQPCVASQAVSQLMPVIPFFSKRKVRRRS